MIKHNQYARGYGAIPHRLKNKWIHEEGEWCLCTGNITDGC